MKSSIDKPQRLAYREYGGKEKIMIIVKKSEWDSICADYKGVWQDYYGEHPEWLGKKVVMSTCITHNPNELCSLLIEGVHFIIGQ